MMTFGLASRVRVAILSGLAATGLAAAPGKAPVEAPARVDPWVDAKSVCLFRLGTGPMPQSPEQLVSAMTEGWKSAIVLPDPHSAVSIEGGSYPSVTSLLINLSDGTLQPSAKKQRIGLNHRVEGNVAVRNLEVRARPLLLHKAKLNMGLVATGAQLELERDRRGRPVMMLADASEGTLTFDVTQADLESLFLFSAREAASKYGLTIQTTRLRVTAETPRSIYAALHVSTLIGFIPAGMMFKAHVVVDEAMNAKIAGLTVDGDEALGPLIVGLLRPSLSHYEGKTRPLVGFPAGRLRLRDVALRVDDSLHLTASFGS